MGLTAADFAVCGRGEGAGGVLAYGSPYGECGNMISASKMDAHLTTCDKLGVDVRSFIESSEHRFSDAL